MRTIKLIIVDDHEMFSAGIKSLLSKDSQFDVVGEATNGQDALEQAMLVNPDIFLMDIQMPIMNGIEATKLIKEKFPASKVLALTIEDREAEILKMVQAGAAGYVLKKSPICVLKDAIQAIYRGNSYFSDNTSEKLFSGIQKQSAKKSKFENCHVTTREMQILEYIAEEMTNKEIASKLYISPRTVETHKRNLIQKLNVKNTVGLVKFYLSARPNEPIL